MDIQTYLGSPVQATITLVLTFFGFRLPLLIVPEPGGNYQT